MHAEIRITSRKVKQDVLGFRENCRSPSNGVSELPLDIKSEMAGVLRFQIAG